MTKLDEKNSYSKHMKKNTTNPVYEGKAKNNLMVAIVFDFIIAQETICNFLINLSKQIMKTYYI